MFEAVSSMSSCRRAATVTALVGLASACGEDRRPTPTLSEDAIPGGTAVVAVASGATTLLPPLAAAALDFELSGTLFLALNFGEWQDGELVYPEAHPLALARSREVGPDGTALTYHLDTSRRWSDGQPIRGEDVAFTYNLLANPELGLPLASTTERLDSVTVVDDSTVTFHFDRPYPGMLFDTGVGIIPKHVYAALPADELQGLPRYQEAGEERLVVSGPFALESWQPNDRIVLVRNPAGETRSLLDRVVVRVVPDEATRRAELMSGGVDLALLNSYRIAAELERGETVAIARIPQRGFDYIGWNPSAHPAFSDPQVRQALSAAIDRTALIAALDMVGYAEPAYGPYGSLFPALATEAPVTPAYDPGRAVRLLDEAGWVDADGDGVRERDGRPLDFELATTAGNERRESAVQIVQQSLAEVGVQANLRFEELGALVGRAINREYEAVLLGWQVGLDPDISMFWRDPESPFNLVGYADPRTQALIDSAQAQTTYEAALPYWRQAANGVAADYPYAFLWFFDFPVAVGPRLYGVEVGVTGFGPSMHRWWIPKELRR
jgi:peptide/nickel transport system substrate-binding protein